MSKASTLKARIQGSCTICGGSGFLGDHTCNCVLKFRAFNRLTGAGFSEHTLDLVSSHEYTPPMVESGAVALDFFMRSIDEVVGKGLSLYIYSRENGLGKTSLAHYLSYLMLCHLSRTENYVPSRYYQFVTAKTLAERESKGWPEGKDWFATLMVIDDLGAESRNAEWKRSGTLSMLHALLHDRLDRKLPTIITSNYTGADVSGLYEGVLDSVLEIQPDGVIGGQRFRQIEVSGDGDFRRMTDAGGWPV